MSKKGKTRRDAQWAEAKRKCRLNAEAVRMAKELGFSPRSLLKNIPGNSEPWKAPVHVWIREMYDRHMVATAHRRVGDNKRPIESAGNAPEDGTPREAAPQQNAAGPDTRDGCAGEPALTCGLEDWPLSDIDGEESEDFAQWGWHNDGPPGRKEIAEQNESMLRRQADFRIAAEQVAQALSRLPFVCRVVLFGSVAAPLRKEVPRFREFRKAGIAVRHECRDVDLAVWVDDLSDLKRLQKARSRALNELFHDTQIGVAHHQVEIFILEPDTDRYLGRLCCFGQCPKGKPECNASGCGATAFLQQHDGFTFGPAALAPGRSQVLYDRGLGLGEVTEEKELPF